MISRGCHVLATPVSASFSRHGWTWVDVDSCDENYLDLAYLLGRGCRIQPQVGCVIVEGVEDGRQARRQGEVLVSGINSFLVGDTQYGKNNGSSGRRKPDCHAEANAVAEGARMGTQLFGASCYVTKPPCITCYTLLCAAGIREIVAPAEMLPRQVQSAADLGIALRVVRCSAERKARRDALTVAHVDRKLAVELREERKLTQGKRYAANLARLKKGGGESELPGSLPGLS